MSDRLATESPEEREAKDKTDEGQTSYGVT